MKSDIDYEPKRSYRFLVDVPGISFLVQNVIFPSMTCDLGVFRPQYEQPIQIQLMGLKGIEFKIKELLSERDFIVPIWFLNSLGEKIGGWNLIDCKGTVAPFCLNYKDLNCINYTLLIVPSSIEVI